MYTCILRFEKKLPTALLQVCQWQIKTEIILLQQNTFNIHCICNNRVWGSHVDKAIYHIFVICQIMEETNAIAVLSKSNTSFGASNIVMLAALNTDVHTMLKWRGDRVSKCAGCVILCAVTFHLYIELNHIYMWRKNLFYSPLKVQWIHFGVIITTRRL